jgi:hypothetical protein
MRPTYLQGKETKTKKQLIWELASEGKHPPTQIASMAGTSVEYVWKVTSILRRAKRDGSLVLNRSIIQQAKRKDEMSIVIRGKEVGAQEVNRNIAGLSNVTQIKRDYKNNGNQYLDVPAMSSDELKNMYSEFDAGKTPIEIISAYGYHPDCVEIEFHRFLRIRDQDVDILLKGIVEDCSRSAEPRGELKHLIDRYRTQGFLTNDEIRQLLELKFEHEYQTRLSMVTFDVDQPLPDGTVRLRCSLCKDPLPDVIVDATSYFGKSVIEYYSNIWCDSCKSKKLNF